jgi:hypothetical protein
MLSIGCETMPERVQADDLARHPHVMATLRTCTGNDPGMIRCGPLRANQTCSTDHG